MNKNNMKNNIVDTFGTKVSVEFFEDNTMIDGRTVLAKVKGEFFCPNGVSRNNRFYSKGLWEKVLKKKNIQEKLERKTMFGTIGHKTPISDESLLEGKISHFVNYLGFSEDGKGIGEAYILDTAAGKNINAVLRAGCEVFVSSRADGRFKGENKGIPAVDEDFFNLETFDFVLDPGFLQANPKIAESLNLETEESNFQGENIMAMERILEENAELKSQIKETLKENSELKASLKAVTEDSEQLKESVTKAEKDISELSEKLTATETELSESKAELAKFDEIGEGFEDIKSTLEKSLAEITAYQEFGSVEQVKEALATADAELEKFEKLGSYEVIEKVILGADKMLNEKIEEERKATISEIATKFKVSESVVESLLNKEFTKEEVETHLTEVFKASDKKDKFGDTKEEDLGESNQDKDKQETVVTRSRLARLVEHFE